MALTKAPEELLARDLTSALSITTADNTSQLTLTSTDTDANVGPRMDLTRDSSSPAASDSLGQIRFMGEDAGDNSISYAHMTSFIVDPTDGSEDGKFEIDVRKAGTQRSRLLLDENETVFNNEAQDIDFRVESDSNTHALFVQASDGNVGIGTSSPATLLELSANNNSAASNNTLRFTDTDTATESNQQIGKIEFKTDDASGDGALVRSYILSASEDVTPSSYISFGTNAGGAGIATAEAMRIDSSGNLLVGTTDTTQFSNASGADHGIVLAANNYIDISRNGNPMLYLNRTDSDGQLAYFSREGSGVGAIGTTGDDLTIFSTVSGHNGLRFHSAGIFPTDNTGAIVDNDADLGHSSYRFKDLYLSGGAFIGGTGTANQLDDYEEGSWTPAIVGSHSQSGQSYSTQTGTYTKVGRQVTCRFQVILTAEGTFGVSYLLLSGFPFALESAPGTIMMGNLYFTGMGDNFISIGLQGYQGQSQAYLWGMKAAATNRDYVAVTDLTDSTQLTGTFTYFV